MTTPCLEKAAEIVDQIREYSKAGIKTKIIIGVDGSPSCGVNKTSKANPRKKMTESQSVKGFGILMEELCLESRKRKVSIPFYGIRYERLSEDLDEMKKLLRD